jgi:hypothetical protein
VINHDHILICSAKGDDDTAKAKRDFISAAERNAVSDKQASGDTSGELRAGMSSVPG